MEVILRKTIDNVGEAGEIVKVKDGYARNFLIPRGLAYQATEDNRRRAEAEAARRAGKVASDRADAEALATRLESLELHFNAKAGEGDKLFGSITSGDIAEQVGAQGFTLDKRVIELEEPIKMIGIYKVPVRLHPEVRTELRVWVVKEE
jgi:large subunit ribosomal protein L9